MRPHCIQVLARVRVALLSTRLLRSVPFSPFSRDEAEA